MTYIQRFVFKLLYRIFFYFVQRYIQTILRLLYIDLLPSIHGGRVNLRPGLICCPSTLFMPVTLPLQKTKILITNINLGINTPYTGCLVISAFQIPGHFQVFPGHTKQKKFIRAKLLYSTARIHRNIFQDFLLQKKLFN